MNNNVTIEFLTVSDGLYQFLTVSDVVTSETGLWQKFANPGVLSCRLWPWVLFRARIHHVNAFVQLSPSCRRAYVLYLFFYWITTDLDTLSLFTKYSSVKQLNGCKGYFVIHWNIIKIEFKCLFLIPVSRLKSKIFLNIPDQFIVKIFFSYLLVFIGFDFFCIPLYSLIRILIINNPYEVLSCYVFFSFFDPWWFLNFLHFSIFLVVNLINVVKVITLAG